MYGAILGDIVGSIYEFDNIKTKEFELFERDCIFTDDTVMTIAVAEATMDLLCEAHGGKAKMIASMKKFGKLFQEPDTVVCSAAGYSGMIHNPMEALVTVRQCGYQAWPGFLMRLNQCVLLRASLRK